MGAVQQAEEITIAQANNQPEPRQDDSGPSVENLEVNMPASSMVTAVPTVGAGMISVMSELGLSVEELNTDAGKQQVLEAVSDEFKPVAEAYFTALDQYNSIEHDKHSISNDEALARIEAYSETLATLSGLQTNFAESGNNPLAVVEEPTQTPEPSPQPDSDGPVLKDIVETVPASSMVIPVPTIDKGLTIVMNELGLSVEDLNTEAGKQQVLDAVSDLYRPAADAYFEALEQYNSFELDKHSISNEEAATRVAAYEQTLSTLEDLQQEFQETGQVIVEPAEEPTPEPQQGSDEVTAQDLRDGIRPENRTVNRPAISDVLTAEIFIQNALDDTATSVSDLDRNLIEERNPDVLPVIDAYNAAEASYEAVIEAQNTLKSDPNNETYIANFEAAEQQHNELLEEYEKANRVYEGLPVQDEEALEMPEATTFQRPGPEDGFGTEFKPRQAPEHHGQPAQPVFGDIVLKGPDIDLAIPENEVIQSLYNPYPTQEELDQALEDLNYGNSRGENGDPYAYSSALEEVERRDIQGPVADIIRDLQTMSPTIEYTNSEGEVVRTTLSPEETLRARVAFAHSVLLPKLIEELPAQIAQNRVEQLGALDGHLTDEVIQELYESQGGEGQLNAEDFDTIRESYSSVMQERATYLAAPVVNVANSIPISPIERLDYTAEGLTPDQVVEAVRDDYVNQGDGRVGSPYGFLEYPSRNGFRFLAQDRTIIFEGGLNARVGTIGDWPDPEGGDKSDGGNSSGGNSGGGNSGGGNSGGGNPGSGNPGGGNPGSGNPGGGNPGSGNPGGGNPGGGNPGGGNPGGGNPGGESTRGGRGTESNGSRGGGRGGTPGGN